MSDDHEHEKEGICLNCLAENVATTVLGIFTETNPKVKMSYRQWRTLGLLIEDEIKAALGVSEPDDDEQPKPGTALQ